MTSYFNRPPKGYPDYGSRVVREKRYDVRPRIELTENGERDWRRIVNY